MCKAFMDCETRSSCARSLQQVLQILRCCRLRVPRQSCEEAGPTVEEEYPLQKLALEPKMVADAIKEELMFMRKVQIYH